MIKRLNVGCGEYPLVGWHNLDTSGVPTVCADAIPLPFLDISLEEIFAGHFLEHLTQPQAGMFMSECWRTLRPGGKLSIVVPDFRTIVARYLNPIANARIEMPPGVWHDTHDLDELCHYFLFSTVQESQHRWAYDRHNLGKLLALHGFKVTGEINQWMDPRISVGAWYQTGYDSVKE